MLSFFYRIYKKLILKMIHEFEKDMKVFSRFISNQPRPLSYRLMDAIAYHASDIFESQKNKIKKINMCPKKRLKI